MTPGEGGGAEMDDARREELGRKGAVELAIGEWLGFSEAEAELVELRVRVAKAIRRRRSEAGMTQVQFAGRIGVSQPVVAKMEDAGPGVSLDRLMKAYFAAGGKVDDLAGARVEESGPGGGRPVAAKGGR